MGVYLLFTAAASGLEVGRKILSWRDRKREEREREKEIAHDSG